MKITCKKSGEKIQEVNWPEKLEIKGKVRLQAFEKFVQELPRSRNRALMVISLRWKAGSSMSGLTSMKEVAKGYTEKAKVGYVEIYTGLDLYICPRTDTVITILAKHGYFKGITALEEDRDSLIGCVVWRKTQQQQQLSNSLSKKQELGQSSQESDSGPRHVSSVTGFPLPPDVLPDVLHRFVESYLAAEKVPKDSELNVVEKITSLVAQPTKTSTDTESNSSTNQAKDLSRNPSDDEHDLPEFDFSSVHKNRVITSNPLTKPTSPYIPPLYKQISLEHGEKNLSVQTNISMKETNDDNDDDMPEWDPPKLDISIRQAYTESFSKFKQHTHIFPPLPQQSQIMSPTLKPISKFEQQEHIFCSLPPNPTISTEFKDQTPRFPPIPNIKQPYQTITPRVMSPNLRPISDFTEKNPSFSPLCSGLDFKRADQHFAMKAPSKPFKPVSEFKEQNPTFPPLRTDLNINRPNPNFTTKVSFKPLIPNSDFKELNPIFHPLPQPNPNITPISEFKGKNPQFPSICHEINLQNPNPTITINVAPSTLKSISEFKQQNPSWNPLLADMNSKQPHKNIKIEVKPEASKAFSGFKEHEILPPNFKPVPEMRGMQVQPRYPPIPVRPLSPQNGQGFSPVIQRGILGPPPNRDSENGNGSSSAKITGGDVKLHSLGSNRDHRRWQRH